VLTRAIGVAVPAHDEADHLPGCLAALRAAVGRHGVPGVRMVVVADTCGDDTPGVARRLGAEVLEVRLRNAGAARAIGLDHLVATSTVPLGELWLATTDADSRVPPDWLARQLQWRSDGWDAVAGTVVVHDWSAHPTGAARRFARHYGPSRHDHPHVHGANFGVSGAAYSQVGGFPRLPVAEDHAMVAALTRCGLRIVRAGDVPVVTSGRPDPRALGGFGSLLGSLNRQAIPCPT
jgi:glycosyltransferase involved in cell wall biosynthesis